MKETASSRTDNVPDEIRDNNGRSTVVPRKLSENKENGRVRPSISDLGEGRGGSGHGYDNRGKHGK